MPNNSFLLCPSIMTLWIKEWERYCYLREKATIIPTNFSTKTPLSPFHILFGSYSMYILKRSDEVGIVGEST